MKKGAFIWQDKLDGGQQIYSTSLTRKPRVCSNLVLLAVWTELKHPLEIRDLKFSSPIILIFFVYFMEMMVHSASHTFLVVLFRG